MKKVKLSATALWMLVLVFTFSACQEDTLAPDAPAAQSEINRKTTGEREIDDLVDHPNDQQVPYPTITHQMFVPEYDFWAEYRCKVWRIEWPEYSELVDPDDIPLIFSTNNGALNSQNYLNSVAPGNTYNAQFAFSPGVRSIGDLWPDLVHTIGAGANLDKVYFARREKDLEDIEYWVKERPGLFISNWQGSTRTKIGVETGDFVLFYNQDQNQYGGIRFVSLNPMIVEIYLAELNH